MLSGLGMLCNQAQSESDNFYCRHYRRAKFAIVRLEPCSRINFRSRFLLFGLLKLLVTTRKNMHLK